MRIAVSVAIPVVVIPVVVGALFSPVLLAGGANAKFDGGYVHYESYGSGSEALVFIHGWTCDLTFWRGQAPLYEKRRSLLVDLPGHGQSSKPEANYTMDRLARGVEAAMRDAGVERAVLVGHSMGGPVALAFVRLFPEKTKAVVFVDAFLPSPPPVTEQDRAKQKQNNEASTALVKAANYKTFAGMVINGMFTDKTPPEMRTEIKTKMLAAKQQVLVSAWEGMQTIPAPEASESYKIPALAIMTAGSTRAAYETRLHAVFPDLRGFETWDGSGHFLMMESPERFNASLSAFLAGL
jgi:pimeloyl-ACP methyl ester carboxylesterase